MEQRQEVDTRRFDTHAQWCQWLAMRGQLAFGHKRCKATDRCVASSDRMVARQLEGARK